MPDSRERSQAAVFSLRRVGRLIAKELREIFRDRRTILTLVAMPLLLYPLISVAFQQFLLSSRVEDGKVAEYRNGFDTDSEQAIFVWLLRLGDIELERHPTKKLGKTEETPAKKTNDPKKDAGETRSPIRWNGLVEPRESLLQKLKSGDIDLVVDIENAEELPPEELMPRLPRDWVHRCKLTYLGHSANSKAALAEVDRRMSAVHSLALSSRLNLPVKRPFPRMVFLAMQREELAAEGAGGTLVSLAALVPLVLILMTITGAVYPAIDLTAGERERGTLEMLMAAPVPRIELLCGKYTAVVAVAVLTALVNLVSMFLTVQLSGMAPMIFGDRGVTPMLILAILGLLVLFAAFFSAVLLALTSFARSFKEAQAYLIPLMLASLAPGVLGLLPGIRLEGVLAVAPLANMVLLARDLFQSEATTLNVWIVTLTTVLYSVAAISLAARVFGAESVLYNEQSSWSDLFRKPETKQPAATVSAALWCLALMLPAHFVFTWILREALPLIAGFEGLLIALINVVLFLGLPAIFIHYGNVDLKPGLALETPRAFAWPAAVILGVSLCPTVFWILSWQRSLVETPNLAETAETLRKSGWMTMVATISAAIVEEWFFRGMLFRAIRTQTGTIATVLLTAILFGLAHVFLGGGLGLTRLLPTTLLGLVLGAVCATTGSVWPGLVLHVIHNAILVTLAQSSLASELESIPPTWLAGSLAGVAVGAVCLWFAKRPDAGHAP